MPYHCCCCDVFFYRCILCCILIIMKSIWGLYTQKNRLNFTFIYKIMFLAKVCLWYYRSRNNSLQVWVVEMVALSTSQFHKEVSNQSMQVLVKDFIRTSSVLWSLGLKTVETVLLCYCACRCSLQHGGDCCLGSPRVFPEITPHVSVLSCVSQEKFGCH